MLAREQVEAERRYRTLHVAATFLVELVKAHSGDRYYLNTRDGLPDDAYLVRADYDGARDLFMLVVGSASFDPVPPRTLPPEIVPEITVTIIPPDGGS